MPITPEDLARADERMQRYDSNHDGYIDRNEAGNGPWRDEPFQFDIGPRWPTEPNGTGTPLCPAATLARRVGLRGPPFNPGAPPPPGPNPSAEEQQRRERERRAMEEAARARGGSRGTRESWHLTETLMIRHDTNRDGLLDAAERRSIGLTAAAADTDRDQRISRPELAAWLAEQESLQGRGVPRELPAWFVEKDSEQRRAGADVGVRRRVDG